MVVSRTSLHSLYDLGLASFGESDTYDHADATGFIKLFGLPARVGGDRDRATEDARERVRELLDASAGV